MKHARIGAHAGTSRQRRTHVQRHREARFRRGLDQKRGESDVGRRTERGDRRRWCVRQRAVAAVQNIDIGQERPDGCGRRWRANRIHLRDRDDFVGLRSAALAAIGGGAVLTAAVMPILAARHLLRRGTHRAFDTRGPAGRTKANQSKGDNEVSERTSHETIVRCEIDNVKQRCRGFRQSVVSQRDHWIDASRTPRGDIARRARDDRQQAHNSGHGDWIICADAKQHARHEAGGRLLRCRRWRIGPIPQVTDCGLAGIRAGARAATLEPWYCREVAAEVRMRSLRL